MYFIPITTLTMEQGFLSALIQECLEDRLHEVQTLVRIYKRKDST